MSLSLQDQQNSVEATSLNDLDFSKIKPLLDIEKPPKHQVTKDSKAKKIRKTKLKTQKLKNELKKNQVNAKSGLNFIEVDVTNESNSNCSDNNVDLQLIETYIKQALLDSGLPLSSIESGLSSLIASINNDSSLTIEDESVNNECNVLGTVENNENATSLANKTNLMKDCLNTPVIDNNVNTIVHQNKFENLPNHSQIGSKQIDIQNDQLCTQNLQVNNVGDVNSIQHNVGDVQNSSSNIPNPESNNMSFQLLHVAYRNPKRQVRKRNVKKVKTSTKVIQNCIDYDHELLMKEAGIEHVSDIPLPPSPPPHKIITTGKDLETVIDSVATYNSSNIIQNTTSKRKQNLLKDIRKEYNVQPKKIKKYTTKLKPILPRFENIDNSEIQILTPINLDTSYALVEVDSYGNVIYVDNNSPNIYTNVIEVDHNTVEDTSLISESIESNNVNSTQNEIDLLLNFAEKSSNMKPKKQVISKPIEDDDDSENTEKLEPSKIIQNILLKSRNMREKSGMSDNLNYLDVDEDDTADIEIFDDSEEELEKSNENEVSNVESVPLPDEENDKAEDDNISVITISDNEDELNSDNIQSENKENESIIEECNVKKPETLEDQIKFFKKFETYFKMLKKDKEQPKSTENKNESVVVKKSTPGKYTVELMRRFFCPFCPKSFTDVPGALLHGKNVHGKNKKSIEFSIEAKEMHVIRCMVCKHIHISYESFKKHVSKYHPPSNEITEEPINCGLCYAPYFKKSDLTHHQHREHGLKPSEGITMPLDLLGAGTIDYSDMIDLDASNDSIGNIQIYNFDDADDLLNYHSNPVPNVDDIDAHFEDLFTIIEQPMPLD